MLQVIQRWSELNIILWRSQGNALTPAPFKQSPCLWISSKTRTSVVHKVFFTSHTDVCPAVEGDRPGPKYDLHKKPGPSFILVGLFHLLCPQLTVFMPSSLPLLSSSALLSRFFTSQWAILILWHNFRAHSMNLLTASTEWTTVCSLKYHY